MGIEPTRPAWKAGILPLNYTRMLLAECFIMIPHHPPFVKSFFKVFLSFFSDVNSQSKCNSSVSNCIYTEKEFVVALSLRKGVSDNAEDQEKKQTHDTR